MILKSYKIKTEYFRNKKDGTPYPYHRCKTVYDIQCNVCDSVFSESMDKCRTGTNHKHLCPSCRSSNQIGILFRQHRQEKEDLSKIGEIRIHNNSRYKEVYVGYDSWHTRHQCNWCREHVYVMEEYLGYKIPKGHVVHHIDGDKANNTIQNLVLLTVEEHNNAHAKSESLIFQLVIAGHIIFNRVTKLYEFN